MKKPVAIFGLILILALIIIPLVIVLSPKVEPENGTARVIEDSRFLLGTVINVKLYGGDGKIFDPLFAEAARLEGLLSLNLPDSELNKINGQAGKAPVRVSSETFDVIERGLHFSQLSGGAFDISIGPLVELWHIGYEDARVPAGWEIRETLPLIDWRKVKLDKAAGTVFLEEPGMLLDLGGIAKGYIADKMGEFLLAHNYSQAILNLGGNVVVLGEKSDGSSFGIGVQDPRDLRGSIIGVLPIKNRSVVTTGTYERYFQVGDTIYHHVLSPFTGYPVDNSLLQATIVSEKSVDGDGLSTGMFSLGLEAAIGLVESLPGVEAVFVDKDNRVYLTSGLSGVFHLTNTSYHLALPSEG